MSSVVLSGDTSGTVTLSVPAVAGTNTVTIAAQTGTLNAAGPSFSAYLSSSQTISSNTQTKINSTFTKVQFDTEEFDTANCYDNSTNYRFTPNVAGYYQVSIGMLSVYSSQTLAYVTLFKNGAEYKRLNSIPGNGNEVNGSALVYLNGSTDYIEAYGLINGSGTLQFYGGQIFTYFQACFVRGA